MNIEKVKSIHLKERDWLKLNDYCKAISNSLMKELPGDWPIDYDDVASTVFDAFLYLLNNYKEGIQSPTSYCWQYGKKIALNALMKEYRIHKLCIEQLEAEFQGDKDSLEAWIEHHQIGKGEVPSLVVDEREAQETHDKTEHILSTFNFIDRKIAELHGRDGYSLPEVAKMIGLSRQAVAKRWDKICAKGWTFRDIEL